MSNADKYQAIADSGSVQGLTPPVNGATKFVLTTEGASATAACRWRADGTDPTNTVGQYLVPGQAFVFDFPASKFRFIRDTAATTALTIHVHYLND